MGGGPGAGLGHAVPGQKSAGSRHFWSSGKWGRSSCRSGARRIATDPGTDATKYLFKLLASSNPEKAGNQLSRDGFQHPRKGVPHTM